MAPLSVLEKEGDTSLKSIVLESKENVKLIENKNIPEKKITTYWGYEKIWITVKEFYTWMKTLNNTFGAPYLAVIIIVYGVSQGYVGTVRDLATSYYWKDVQKLQPASTQAFEAFIGMPWNIKPVYGLITDTFPIAGFQRWPYLAICGIIGACCLWILSILSSPPPWFGVLLLMTVALCTAFPDVVVDATMAEQSRKFPAFASDLQSLSWGSLSVGGLVGCFVSGAAVHSFGPTGSFLFISAAPLMLLVAAWALPEKRLPKGLRRAKFGAMTKTLKLFGETVKDPIIWKPALYIYISKSFCPDISDAMFYWFTDSQVGPGFSEQFIGLVGAIAYVAMLAGVALYNCWFQFYNLRKMFLWPQVAYCVMGLLDIIIVRRWNLNVGVPDHVFVVGDATLTDVIGRLQLIPFMVLSARLCPPGIEGTVFAFLMSVSNFGSTCAAWFGSILLRHLHVRRQDYSSLWIAVLIRALLRLSPLLFLRLLPPGALDDIQPPPLGTQHDESTEKDDETVHILEPSQEMAVINHH